LVGLDSQWPSEAVPDFRQFLPSVAIGQEPIVANAHQSLRENMQQPATDKLFSRQAHHALHPVIPVILPVEVGAALIHSHPSVVADGDAVGRVCDTALNIRFQVIAACRSPIARFPR